MILQFEYLKQVLAAVLLDAQSSSITVETILIDIFSFPAPFCKFVLAEKEGKDLFGFSPVEWRNVFGFAMALKGQIPLQGLKFKSKAADPRDDARYGILGPILALYARDSGNYTKDFSNELGENPFYSTVSTEVKPENVTSITLHSYLVKYRSDELLDLLPNNLRDALASAANIPK
jgi:hypothetical protein